jgi:Tol biopolymer transport system component
MKRALIPAIFIAACGAALFGPASAVQPPAPGKLTLEQLIDIHHPSSPMWAPDGRHVAFVWDRAGVSGVYVADASAGSVPPRPLKDAGAQLAGAFWSMDGRALMIPKDGDLWRVPIDGGAASAVWTTAAAESSLAATPDRTRVAFVRPASNPGDGGSTTTGAELWVRTLADGREVLVTRTDRTITAVTWSPDSQFLAFTSGASTIRHEQTPPYSGSKIIYTVNENVPGETMIVAAAGGTPRSVAAGSGGFGGRRWLDARHLLVDRVSPDFKRRTTSLIDIANPGAKVLHEDVEEKFWSMPGDAAGGSQPSPDGKWIPHRYA